MMRTFTIPDDAAAQWKHFSENIKELNGKLAFQDDMKPNIDQIYMTPAASKNKVYFMWDFVARMLAMLGNVPTNLQGMDSMQQEVWGDVQSRALMARNNHLGHQCRHVGHDAHGFQVSSTYPGQTDQPPAFGEEIMTIARRI